MKKHHNKWTIVYIVQGNYGCGWEDVYEGSEPRPYNDARTRLQEYRLNEPEHHHRLISRRIRTESEEPND